MDGRKLLCPKFATSYLDLNLSKNYKEPFNLSVESHKVNKMVVAKVFRILFHPVPKSNIQLYGSIGFDLARVPSTCASN